MESFNPTGSLKDRACLANIEDAIASGALKPGMTILDASSGNMACSLAYFGHILGYPVTVVCSTKLTQDKASFIGFFGGTLIRHGTSTRDGNKFCRKTLLAQSPEKYCFLDQLHNWANPRAAYDKMGPELLSDFPELTAVVGSMGSGGTMLGTAQYLRDAKSRACVITVEAATGTKLAGIAALDDGDYVTPFIQKGFDEQLFTMRAKSSIHHAEERVKELRKQGFFVDLQTGAVVHAAIENIQALSLSGDIVAISSDSGWRTMDALTQAFARK